MVNSDRGRGILTESDREYLRLSDGEREEKYSAPARSKRRRAIHDRTLNGLLDFTHLLEQPADGRESVFEKTDRQKQLDDLPTEGERRLRGGVDVPDRQPRDDLIGSLTDAIAYIHLGLKDRSGSVDLLEGIIREGIKKGEMVGYGRAVDVEVSIEIESATEDVELEVLLEKYLSDEELSEDEWKILLDHAPESVVKGAFSELGEE